MASQSVVSRGGTSAFKAPPAGGTAAPDRAKRWQNSQQQAAGSRQAAQTDRSVPQRQESLADSSSAGGEKTSQIGGYLSSVGGDSQMPVDEEFEAAWFPPADVRHIPNGALAEWTLAGTRPGMSHPPYDPQVREDLLAYLRAADMHPSKEPSGSIERSTSTVSSKGGHSRSGYTTASANVKDSYASAEARKSVHLAAPLDKVPEDRSTSLDSPRGSEASQRSKKALAGRNKTPLSELWAWGDSHNKLKKPDTLHDHDEARKKRELQALTRDLGWSIENARGDDLAHLAIYHNHFTRHGLSKEPGTSAGSLALKTAGGFPQVPHSQQVRSLRLVLQPEEEEEEEADPDHDPLLGLKAMFALRPKGLETADESPKGSKSPSKSGSATPNRSNLASPNASLKKGFSLPKLVEATEAQEGAASARARDDDWSPIRALGASSSQPALRTASRMVTPLMPMPSGRVSSRHSSAASVASASPGLRKSATGMVLNRDYLLKMAEKSKSVGPHMLQLMAREANVSMVTGSPHKPVMR